jgi:hypothetical protein
MSDGFIPLYDLESLTEPQRQEYLKAVCKHMGVPDNLNLVALTYVDDGDGPSRLVPYAKRGATENVRNNLQIDIESLTSQMIGGSIVFTAIARSKPTGRREISTGSKFIDGLQGTQLDDSIMTAQTRALRRVTLQFIGAGVLDESEVNQRKTVHAVSAPIAPTPQPTVAPSSQPGKDITVVDTCSSDGSLVGVKIESKMVGEYCDFAQPDNPDGTDPAKKRADTIAQLNAQNPPKEGDSLQTSAEAKKPRKPRGPNKKKVDLGPSGPPPAQPVIIPATVSAPIAINPVAPSVIEAPKADIIPAIKPKCDPALLKTYRVRHFQIMNTMELEGGFTGSEGMGKPDKVRSFAALMFPDITNFNDLTSEQWEKYLGFLENKIKTEGATATVKYVEAAIGL